MRAHRNSRLAVVLGALLALGSFACGGAPAESTSPSAADATAGSAPVVRTAGETRSGRKW